MKNCDKSKVSAHNLDQIGGKQTGATEACFQHVERSDSVADSQDGLKCEQLQPLVYLFDKPCGMSTFDVIRRVRPFLLKEKREKIGHFGTLDPFASGLVMVGVGSATRLAPLVHEYLKKSYCAKGILGEKRDTGDLTGKVVQTFKREWHGSDGIQIKCRLEQNVRTLREKDYWQTPPAYSAAKYRGKSLHHYARNGISVSKPPVLREIYHLKISSCSPPCVEFEVEVGAGTYIRVLWEDMAQDLGGYLASLRRLSYGPIGVERALPVPRAFESLPAKIPCLHPHQVLPFPKVWANKDWSAKLLCGNPIALKALEGDREEAHAYRWVFGPGDILLGLGEIKENHLIPKINFLSALRKC